MLRHPPSTKSHGLAGTMYLFYLGSEKTPHIIQNWMTPSRDPRYEVNGTNDEPNLQPLDYSKRSELLPQPLDYSKRSELLPQPIDYSKRSELLRAANSQPLLHQPFDYSNPSELLPQPIDYSKRSDLLRALHPSQERAIPTSRSEHGQSDSFEYGQTFPSDTFYHRMLRDHTTYAHSFPTNGAHVQMPPTNTSHDQRFPSHTTYDQSSPLNNPSGQSSPTNPCHDQTSPMDITNGETPPTNTIHDQTFATSHDQTFPTDTSYGYMFPTNGAHVQMPPTNTIHDQAFATSHGEPFPTNTSYGHSFPTDDAQGQTLPTNTVHDQTFPSHTTYDQSSPLNNPSAQAPSTNTIQDQMLPTTHGHVPMGLIRSRTMRRNYRLIPYPTSNQNGRPPVISPNPTPVLDKKCPPTGPLLSNAPNASKSGSELAPTLVVDTCPPAKKRRKPRKLAAVVSKSAKSAAVVSNSEAVGTLRHSSDEIRSTSSGREEHEKTLTELEAEEEFMRLKVLADAVLKHVRRNVSLNTKLRMIKLLSKLPRRKLVDDLERGFKRWRRRRFVSNSEWEAYFYKDVCGVSTFSQKWLSNPLGFGHIIRRSVIVFKDMETDIHALLQDLTVEGRILLEALQKNIISKFSPYSPSEWAKVHTKRYSLRLMCFFSGKIRAVCFANRKTNYTRRCEKEEEKEKEKEKACFDLVHRILSNYDFKIPHCIKNKCSKEECKMSSLWLAATENTSNKEETNFYVDALQTIVPPFLAQAICDGKLPKLKASLEEWLKSFADGKDLIVILEWHNRWKKK